MSGSFATTRWSQVLAAGSTDQAAAHAALAWLCGCQWEPLRRAAVRLGVPPAQAEDAVQDFCCRLIERRADLGALDPAAGRFRAWLIVVFRRFIKDRRMRSAAVVHGGGARHLDVTLIDVAGTDVMADGDAEFDRDWAGAVLARGLGRLLAEQSTPESRMRFERLRPHLSSNADPGAYAATGVALGISEGAVKVAVHRLRQRLRQLLRQEVAETLAEPTPRAIDDELAALVAALARPV